MIDLLLSYENANLATIAKTSNGKFPDELATDQTITDYLRPTRLRAYMEIEENSQKNQQHDLKKLEEGTAFQVFIKTLTGKTIIIIVTREDTGENITAKIHEKTGIPHNQQRIIYGGKKLRDDLTLADYDIGKDATLHLVINLPGGYY
ncbi:unnamed protein product [Rotaria sp. Silwood1]|nr:unnamed protein product [Rotaria sp. Silwood1]